MLRSAPFLWALAWGTAALYALPVSADDRRMTGEDPQLISGQAAQTDTRDRTTSDHKSSSTGSAPVATAEDVLKDLQKKRPANVPITPASVLNGMGPADDPGMLLPEGYPVAMRPGHLVQEDSWWVFVFTSEPNDLPHHFPRMKLLPGKELEQMVTSVENTDNDLLFVVQGEVTVYRGENYLLSGFARLLGQSTDNPADESGEHKKQENATEAPENAADKQQGDTSVEDVLKALRQQRPPSLSGARRRTPTGGGATAEGKGLLTGTASDTSGRDGVDGAGGRRVLLRERHPISMRPGRLVEEGGWWILVFESDHPDYPEPRMRVLPCKQLERMTDAIRGTTTGIVFIVSGEVTVYQGENYLLPRVARRRIETGNLSN